MPSRTKIQDFINKVNATYKGNVLALGGEFDALSISRFSSGILSLDLALGGGWPNGRIVIIAGDESTGKTLKAIKACAEIEKYDHKTKKHKDFCKDGFVPGTALYVDVEGDFDIEWAKKNGFNAGHHVVARPDYSEQAIDLVSSAVSENIFDLIVVDSIAALTPTTEVSESVENWQMGLHARLVNKFVRKVNSGLNKLNQRDEIGPTVLCVNQFRVKIGQFMGDPRVMPGGMGQKFCASIIVYTKSSKFEDTKDKELGLVSLGGVCHKNKTYVPKVNFAYKLALKDQENKKTGEIDNVNQLFNFGKKYNLIATEKGAKFGKHKFSTQKELKQVLRSSELMQRSLWMSVLNAAVR